MDLDPFGAGKHRCVGNAFAMMQLKAIFSVILRDYEFELAQPSETYRNDVSKMVVQLEQPCAVRLAAEDGRHEDLVADRDLCQGHAMCELEAPEVFAAEDRTDEVDVLRDHPASQAHAVASAVQYCPPVHCRSRRMT